MLKKILIRLGLSVFMVLGAASAVLVLMFLFRRSEPRAFDAAEWRAVTDVGVDDRRLLMADDVVRRVALVGRAEAEVAELLGEPDDRTHRELHYRLGQVGLSALRQRELVIVVLGGQVVSAHIDGR